MSTRSTIWMREETDEAVGLHLYWDLMHGVEDPICLEITCVAFECVVRIPNEMVEAIKKITIEQGAATGQGKTRE